MIDNKALNRANWIIAVGIVFLAQATIVLLVIGGILAKADNDANTASRAAYAAADAASMNRAHTILGFFCSDLAANDELRERLWAVMPLPTSPSVAAARESVRADVRKHSIERAAECASLIHDVAIDPRMRQP